MLAQSSLTAAPGGTVASAVVPNPAGSPSTATAQSDRPVPCPVLLRRDDRAGVVAVGVLLPHRDPTSGGVAPVVLGVSVRFPLSFEDLVAVMYYVWLEAGPESWGTPEDVRQWVADLVAVRGSGGIEEVRCELASGRANGTVDVAGLRLCEQLVQGAFELAAAESPELSVSATTARAWWAA